MKHRLKLLASFLLYIGTTFSIHSQNSFRQKDPLCVTDIAEIGNGNIVMTEKLTRRVTIYNQKVTQIQKEIFFDQIPTGICARENKIFVTLFEHKGELIILNNDGDIQKRIATKHGTVSPLLHPTESRMYVLNQFSNNVQEIDLDKELVTREVNVLREPRSGVIDKTGKYLFVANFLPTGRADQDTVAACISVIDLKSFKKINDIPLYNGSNALRGICMSPDEKYVFVTHNLGRFQVPTNQLQQGWMNTSAMSILNARDLRLEGTVLLDDPERGAAGIWGIGCTANNIMITHSGTHELSLIDYQDFITRFEHFEDKKTLAYDLRFLYGLRRRIPLTGNGPRSFLIKDEEILIPAYFSDHLNFVSLPDGAVRAIQLVSDREVSSVLKGEKYFNDASYCFQNWQSCNGCHPGEGRTDGMNWDLMNDGIGNPKNCKSMLYSHVTPPSMISGIRESAELAVRKGFALIQFYDCPEDTAVCVDDYLRSLKPVSSPYLQNGQLSEKAQRGRTVFEKHNCTDCHSGPCFTDLQMYRIGNDVEFEKGWDTPTLIEVWRTAPYLFDGRAGTLKDVFQVHKHGIKKKISEKEIDELTEYVNSL